MLVCNGAEWRVTRTNGECRGRKLAPVQHSVFLLSTNTSCPTARMVSGDSSGQDAVSASLPWQLPLIDLDKVSEANKTDAVANRRARDCPLVRIDAVHIVRVCVHWPG